MLWFNHPKPVGNRKPIAVLVQQHRDQRNTTTLETPRADIPTLHDTAELALMPLEFSVRYSLFEYVSFMWQHAHHLIRRRRIQAPASWYMLIKSTWASAFHFVTQGRSRHTYAFTIDRHGIVRTGPGGVTLIGWEDVSAIRSYSRGRLMVLKRGTLPIPSRCLTREQSDSLAGYAALIKTTAH
ncbi:MAG: YcxB family protein [Telluria sp.]